MKTKERCPGEEICTTDRFRGECARYGRTLETHCQENGCRMYFTKAGITPIEFRGMMQAVFILRAKRNGKLKLHEELFPHWAEQAYMLGNAVFNQVEQEEMESVGGEGESDFALKGKGDSGAFSAIFDYMQESDARSKGDAGT